MCGNVVKLLNKTIMNSVYGWCCLNYRCPLNVTCKWVFWSS